MRDDRRYDYPPELYKSNLLLWQSVFITDQIHGRHLHNMNGPFCPKCRGDIKSDDPNNSLNAQCIVCDQSFKLKAPINTLKSYAYSAFQAKLKENFRVDSLDLPPDLISHVDENDKYWIEARLGQKNGKLCAVIFMGEKLPKQTKKDYIQIFADIEDQQIRFDKGNKNPLKLLAHINAEFEEVSIQVDKKSQ